MTDREKAIVMAYTGACMLEGDKLDEFYRYLAELYGRPVYTHELIALDIEHKSKPDFLKLCDEEEPERKVGKWKHDADGLVWCDTCGFGKERSDDRLYRFCPNCGDRMEEGEQNGQIRYLYRNTFELHHICDHCGEWRYYQHQKFCGECGLKIEYF